MISPPQSLLGNIIHHNAVATRGKTIEEVEGERWLMISPVSLLHISELIFINVLIGPWDVFVVDAPATDGEINVRSCSRGGTDRR